MAPTKGGNFYFNIFKAINLSILTDSECYQEVIILSIFKIRLENYLYEE